MEREILNIAISGEEKNKNEIIYNNIVEAMDNLQMSKEDQIEYLKTKVSSMESEYQNNIAILVVLVISALLLGLGLYLVATEQVVLGVILVLISFILSVAKLLLTLKKYTSIRSKKYVELESLRNNLNSILK